jgi:hypothetical protein
MTQAFDNQACEMIQAPRSAAGYRDARADGGERDVTLSASRVTIRRRYAGVRMNIGVPTRAYCGVVLSLEETAGGRWCYRVTLRHADPDLSVVLSEAFEECGVVEDTRDWARFLAQTPLLERAAGTLEPLDQTTLQSISAAQKAPHLLVRRRGRPAASRSRGRFARHRKPAKFAVATWSKETEPQRVGQD